jgi:hypothetical protein
VQFYEIKETEFTTTMRSLLPQLLGLGFTFIGLGALAGCASKAPPPVVPQATLAAVVTVPAAAEPEPAAAEAAAAPAPERVKHHVEISVDHLPAPKTFAPGATTYVFWVRASDEEAWSNAAHLDRSDVAQEANFDFAEDTLFVHVTAEPAADVRKPSEKVVLSTRVSRNGACAHSVDEHDVTMKVRMCR